MKHSREVKLPSLLIVICLALVPMVQAAVWVSPSGQASWQNARSPTPLTGAACCSLAVANANASAGDTVYLRAGSYVNQKIRPAKSGTAGHPITYINYGTEAVNISEGSQGVYLDGKSYIVVQGLAFTKLDAFLYIFNGANHNEIAYCTFDTVRNRTAWRGSTIYRGSSYNHVHHCRFSKYGQYTNDDLGAVFDIGNEDDSTDLTSHNLIEDCVMYHGGHHVLSVSGMYNVIRNNWLHNEPWAMGAANADRGAIMYGDRVVSLSSGYPQNTGRNLFENNRIGYASDPPDNLGASNLCLGSAGNIVRFNYLFHSDRAAIAMTLTSTYWSSIVDNKIYNNTLFHNGLNTQDPIDQSNSGIYLAIYSGTNIIKNNVFKNNLLFENGKIQSPSGKAFGAYKANLADQTFAGNWDGDNQGDPQFVNAAPVLGDPFSATLPDLRLKAASPCINKGVALTTIVSATGSGASFQVADAGYFTDGWGISNVNGDEIQLSGTDQRARITRINYTTKALTVDKSLTWTQSQGVGLPYEESAPEIGAYEYGPVSINTPPFPFSKELSFDVRLTHLYGSALYAISYTLPSSTLVDLAIYNMSGKMVRTAVRGQKAGGTYTEYFDTKGIFAGALVCRLETRWGTTAKMLLTIH